MEELLSKYANKNDLEIDNETTESIKGVVADLKSAVIKGDTVYFFKVDGKITRLRPQYQMTFLTLKMVKPLKVK